MIKGHSADLLTSNPPRDVALPRVCSDSLEKLVEQLVQEDESPTRLRAYSSQPPSSFRPTERQVGPILNLSFREFIGQERLLKGWKKIQNHQSQQKERNSNSTADSESEALGYSFMQMFGYMFVPRVEDEFAIDPVMIQSDKRTAIMIKNIPNKYNQALLVEEINERFKEQYDFLYLPIDPKNKCNVGYAFINFTNTRSILDFYWNYNGKRWRKFNSEKVCELRYARMQGRQSLVRHFQGAQKDRTLKHN